MTPLRDTALVNVWKDFIGLICAKNATNAENEDWNAWKSTLL